MDLDVKYLGTSLTLPSWSLLLLAAPAPEKIGSLYVDEGAQNLMNADANWGMVLKIGDRAFEDNPKGVCYKPGDWVFFEDFHPQARMVHEQRVYFIPDTRVMCGIPFPETFEPYVDFYNMLPGLELKALETTERVNAKWADTLERSDSDDIR